MLHRLILKVTKFQLPPPPKHLGTVVKNILGGHHACPPCQIGLNRHRKASQFTYDYTHEETRDKELYSHQTVNLNFSELPLCITS